MACGWCCSEHRTRRISSSEVSVHNADLQLCFANSVEVILQHGIQVSYNHAGVSLGGQAAGMLTNCENEFAHLEESFPRKKSSVQNVLPAFENGSPHC